MLWHPRQLEIYDSLSKQFIELVVFLDTFPDMAHELIVVIARCFRLPIRVFLNVRRRCSRPSVILPDMQICTILLFGRWGEGHCPVSFLRLAFFILTLHRIAHAQSILCGPACQGLQHQEHSGRADNRALAAAPKPTSWTARRSEGICTTSSRRS